MTNELITAEVISLADVRALRAAKAELPLNIPQESLDQLTARELFWWVNNLFLFTRIASSASFGKVSYELGHLDGIRVCSFDCDAFHAYYQLTDSLLIDLDRPPIVVRYSAAGVCEYPITEVSGFIPDELAAEEWE